MSYVYGFRDGKPYTSWDSVRIGTFSYMQHGKNPVNFRDMKQKLNIKSAFSTLFVFHCGC